MWIAQFNKYVEAAFNINLLWVGLENLNLGYMWDTCYKYFPKDVQNHLKDLYMSVCFCIDIYGDSFIFNQQ